MKKFSIFLSAIALLASCSAPVTQEFHDNPVIAHRGAWKETGHPQNSLASFKSAAEIGCHGSECDVWITADDSLIIFHDATRDGMLLETSTYAELTAKPLANGEKIPTLREYIAFSQQYPQTKLIIDVKSHKDPERTRAVFHATDKVVKEMNYESKVEYLIGYLPLFKEFSSMTDRPIAYLGRWKNELPEMHPDTIAAYGVKYIDYQDVHYEAHPEWVERFKADKIHLNAWTINSEEAMDFYLASKFNYITTDYPTLLLQKSSKK